MNLIDVTVESTYSDCLNKENILLDVRTPTEWKEGIPQNALCLELSELQHKAGQLLSKDVNYYVMCRSGNRSRQAIEILTNLGFSRLLHVYQGFIGWRKENLPVEYPHIEEDKVRYARHYQLRGFGKQAQQRLKQSHVLMIGAGGLGSSSALYLAASGIGEMTIVDDDVVELSNLQRQVIHSVSSIGSLKVESAQNRLNGLNPTIKINPVSQRLNAENAESLIRNCDVVIDGSDNLNTRYLVNDMCLKYKKPLVYSAVYEYEAQITSFDFRELDSPCLRCLFPQTEGFEPENCSELGVLGVVPGLAGIMQATEAIKLITGTGETLQNQLLTIDLLTTDFRKISFKKLDKCNKH